MRPHPLRRLAVFVLVLAATAAPIAMALPPRPGGGSGCEVCSGSPPNRYCSSTSAGGYQNCQTDYYGNCIASSPCGSSLTVTP